MKRLIILTVTLLFTHAIIAQDGSMVLTHHKDSVRYNVINLDQNHFTFKLRDGKQRDSSRVLNNNIQREAYNYAASLPSSSTDMLPWRISFSAGYGLRIAPTPYDLPDELVSYKNGLRTGLSMGADFSRFFTPNIGLGVKYNLFRTQNQSPVLSYTVGASEVSRSRSDNIYVHYIGPSFTLRTIAKEDKLYTNFEFSLGYTPYYNDHYLDGNRFNVKGSNFGFVSSIGADFVINRGVSLGVNMNIMAASIDKLKVNGKDVSLGKEDIENLSRISLGVVMRYYR